MYFTITSVYIRKGKHHDHYSLLWVYMLHMQNSLTPIRHIFSMLLYALLILLRYGIERNKIILILILIIANMRWHRLYWMESVRCRPGQGCIVNNIQAVLDICRTRYVHSSICIKKNIWSPSTRSIAPLDSISVTKSWQPCWANKHGEAINFYRFVKILFQLICKYFDISSTI